MKMRLTIDEYSKHFKMSKEMIHSKLRSKKLNYIIEEGETYIVVPKSKTDSDKIKAIDAEKKQKAQPTMQQPQKQKITVATLIELYKRENQALKTKIKELEEKIDKLIDDKEQMLREERERIEKVYASKDEQLKKVLELINAQMKLQHTPPQEENTLEVIAQNSRLVELKEYLKSLDLEPHQRKIIKKRFQAVKGADIRVQEQNGKIYLDFSKYDYTDLLTL
jgi:exonuclease VII large subunit